MLLHLTVGGFLSLPEEIRSTGDSISVGTSSELIIRCHNDYWQDDRLIRQPLQ